MSNLNDKKYRQTAKKKKQQAAKPQISRTNLIIYVLCFAIFLGYIFFKPSESSSAFFQVFNNIA